MSSVKFSKEFITPIGLKEWVTLDWDVDVPFDEKKAMEALSRVKEFVCNYQGNGQVILDDSRPSGSGLYQSVPPGPPPIIQVNAGDREVGVTVESIMSCQDLVTLDTYKLIIRGNHELTIAYELRREQLFNS